MKMGWGGWDFCFCFVFRRGMGSWGWGWGSIRDGFFWGFLDLGGGVERGGKGGKGERWVLVVG